MRLKSDEILVLCGQTDGIAEDRVRSIKKKFLGLGFTNAKGELTDRGEHVAAKFESSKPSPKPPKAEGGEGKKTKPKPKLESEKNDGATNRPQGPNVEG
jgi:hypothetical protein